MGFEGKEAIILALYQLYLKAKPLICKGFRFIQQALLKIGLVTEYQIVNNEAIIFSALFKNYCHESLLYLGIDKKHWQEVLSLWSFAMHQRRAMSGV